ncbi:MAG TPA: hypothetical protein VGP92_03835, partial [Acidimicrobiia bacterium]|nr:hypothetical protein [Acidimicrobiia bacterium]
ASERALQEIARLEQPGDTVLSVPADCDPSFVSLQVFHHAPVVGCAGSFAANPWSKLRAYTESAAFTKLRCDRLTYGRLVTTQNATTGNATTRRATTPFRPADVDSLRRSFGVRFVVIDHTKLGAGCASVGASLPILRAHRLLGADHRYEVIDLGQPATG